MATLNTDIRYIKGVGEARAKSLAKLGITDLRSLLSYFPRAYDDRRAYKKIAGLIPGALAHSQGARPYQAPRRRRDRRA